MENQVTIKKEAVLEAYKQASEEQKKIMETLFGKDVFFSQDITERIKTFQDAVLFLGYDNQTVIDYHRISNINSSKDIIAFAKLRVITEALNEGWEPTFDCEECRYYPWFSIYRKAEYNELNEYDKKECFVFPQSCSGSYTDGVAVFANTYICSSSTGSSRSSRLALKTKALAIYCGRQFIGIWADYLFS